MEQDYNKNLLKKGILVRGSAAFPLLISLIILILGLLLSIYIYHSEEEKHRKIEEALLSESFEKLKIFFDSKKFLLEVMAKEVKDLFKYNFFNEKNFKVMAGNFYSYEEGIRAINWIDPEGTIKIVYPPDRNIKALNKSILNHRYARNTFLNAKHNLTPTVTDVAPLFQGGEGIAFYYPIVVNGKLRGFLNLVLSIEKVIEILTRKHSKGLIILLEDSKKVFYNSYGKNIKGLKELKPLKYYIYGKFFKVKAIEKALLKKNFLIIPLTIFFIFSLTSFITFFFTKKIVEIRKEMVDLIDYFPFPIIMFKTEFKDINSPISISNFTHTYSNKAAKKVFPELKKYHYYTPPKKILNFINSLKDLYIFKGETAKSLMFGESFGKSFAIEIGDKTYDAVFSTFSFEKETFFIITLKDISVERELQNIIGKIASMSSDAVILVDENFTYVDGFTNVKDRKYKNYFKTLLGKKVGESFGKDPRNRCLTKLYMENIKKCFENENRKITFDYDVYIDDTVLTILANCTQVKKGEKRYVIITLKDISDLKRLRERIQKSERINTIAELTAGMAHDINNYLSIIYFSSEIIEGFLKSKGIKEEKTIKEATKSLKEYIKKSKKIMEQILSYNKNVLSIPTIVDLNKEIKFSLEIITKTFSDKLKLSLIEKEKNLKIKFANNKLFDIIYNLVKNSIESKDDMVNVTVEVDKANYREICNHFEESYPMEKIDENREYAKIVVNDDGPGIKKDIIKKVLDPFFTTKEKSGGTGLGLSEVFGLVKTFDGFLFLENRSEGGLSVIIYLPLFTEEKEEKN